MNNITKYLMGFAVILFAVNLSGQTTLTVTTGTPTLDGVIGAGEWTSGTLTTQNGVTLQAMADGQFLYLAATWSDASSTENVLKKLWSFDGSSWSQSGNEDRLAFIWDMGLNGADGPNCTTMCHAPLMHTNNGFVDVWHWKAARSNPMGVADDKYWDTSDRQSDPGTSSYMDNASMGSGFPSFMALNDPGANVDFLALDANTLANFDPFGTVLPSHTVNEAVAFDSNATFASGNVIPGYVHRVPSGDRASVQSAGKYDNGTWTVEFKKPYAGSSFDFEVIPGSSVDFTHEVFDNEGGSHANNGIDPTVYTLDFSIITSVDEPNLTVIPEDFSLEQNYPNPFNPTTTIKFDISQRSHVSLKIFNLSGQEVATVYNQETAPGKYEVKFDASHLASGVYFYSLITESSTQTRKMILIK